MATKLGVSVFPRCAEGSNVYLRGDERILSGAAGGHMDYRGAVDAEELTAAVRRLDEMARELPAKSPWA